MVQECMSCMLVLREGGEKSNLCPQGLNQLPKRNVWEDYESTQTAAKPLKRDTALMVYKYY